MKASEIYEEITRRILDLLDKGTVPWRIPWRAEWPQNLFTKHRYAGINYVLLTNAGFGSPYWSTKDQIYKYGGRVRRGQETKPPAFLQAVDLLRARRDSNSLPLVRSLAGSPSQRSLVVRK